MFVPIFTLNLNHKLLPGRIAIGEFDGEHPCLVAATTGERVLIHTPHQKLTGTLLDKFYVKIPNHILFFRAYSSSWKNASWISKSRNSHAKH